MSGKGKLVRLAKDVKQTGRSIRAKKKRDELRKQLEEEELSGTGPKLEQKPAWERLIEDEKAVGKMKGAAYVGVTALGIGGLLSGPHSREKNKKKNKTTKQKRIEEQAEKFINQTKSLQEVKRDPKLRALYGDWLSTMED